MSKIICDVCGTAYPETASQCPICGTAKTDAAVPTGDLGTEEADKAYVKGGRFSSSNVRRRNNGKQELPRVAAVPKAPKQESAPGKEVKREEKTGNSQNNLGLIIIVVILVLAIIAVCTYIAIKWIDNLGGFGGQESTPPATSTPFVEDIPCTSLKLEGGNEFTLGKAGDTLKLEVKAEPENTTDMIQFASDKPECVKVDSNGIVTAVAKGEAIITITCGDWNVQCKIICNAEPIPSDPSNPTDPSDPTDPTDPSRPPVELKLNRKDFTLSGYGASHNLYSGELDPTQITWTSDNPEVATVTNGKVTAVGNGKTTIHAEYQGQKASCIVRCNGVEKPADTKYELHTAYGKATDITIKVGESITLMLMEKETGLRVPAADLKFSVAKEGYVTVDKKGRVEGIDTNYGGVYVYVEYEGVTYKCLVRISKAS